MSLINCKVELKIKWSKYCVLPADDNDSEIANDANANRPIFSIKDTKLYIPVVTFSVRHHQKLSKSRSKGFERSPKRFNKGFERSLYWNKYKTKSDNKNTTNEFRCFIWMNIKQKVIVKIQQTNLDAFLNQILLESIDYLFLVYTNQDATSKRFKARRYYLPKGITKNYDVVINGKNVYY